MRKIKEFGPLAKFLLIAGSVLMMPAISFGQMDLDLIERKLRRLEVGRWSGFQRRASTTERPERRRGKNQGHKGIRIC